MVLTWHPTGGPVVGTLTDPGQRDTVGPHAGGCSLCRALAVAATGRSLAER
jgi:hypothetical protein